MSAGGDRRVSTGDAVAPMHGAYDALLFDLDGVLYRADEPVPGAAPTLDALRAAGATMRFLTNNSARTPDRVAARLRDMGIEASSAEVLTSGMATAALLRRESTEARTAFVVGERGVRQALDAAGVETLDGEPDRADLVVVGWDRELTYDKLRTAALLVQRGARLVATNADVTYPAPDGLWPGAGSILAAVVAATGATPTIVGKPSRPLFEAAAESTGATHPLVVGDRLDTDIAGAGAMGWDSLLVTTGASDLSDLADADTLPTYVAGSLSSLLSPRAPAHPRPARGADLAALSDLLRASSVPETALRTASARAATTLLPGPGPADPAATASVLLLEGGLGVLRGVAVAREFRGQGLGSLVVAAAARDAGRRGVRTLTLLTDGADGFFGRLGFTLVARSELPRVVLGDPDATSGCADTAVAMVREVREVGT